MKKQSKLLLTTAILIACNWTSGLKAQQLPTPVSELVSGEEYIILNANESLQKRNWYIDWQNFRTRQDTDGPKTTVTFRAVSESGGWSFQITSNDYKDSYLGRWNDNIQALSDKQIWTIEYVSAKQGFTMNVLGEESSKSGMMMNGDATWVVSYDISKTNDQTADTKHWRFYRPADFQKDTYTFDATEWAFTGDAGRINQDDISVSNNEIIMNNVRVDNSANLKFCGSNVYTFPFPVKKFVVTGTNLSTVTSQHELWFMNYGWHGGNPVEATTNDDGTVTLTWNMNEGAGWTFQYTGGNSTQFGPRAASADQPIVITDIHFEMAYSRETAAGNFGTICLPYKATTTQATVYRVASVTSNNLSLEALDNEEMEAGVPYIFCATEANPSFNLTGEAVAAPVAATGLVGTFTATTAPQGADYFVLSGNKLYNVDYDGVAVGANRAYIDLTAVPQSSAKSAVSLELIGGGTTAIDAIVNHGSNNTVLDLTGRAVAGQKKSGLYIINGKKAVIK